MRRLGSHVMVSGAQTEVDNEIVSETKLAVQQRSVFCTGWATASHYQGRVPLKYHRNQQTLHYHIGKPGWAVHYSRASQTLQTQTEL